MLKFETASIAVLCLACYSKREVPEVSGTQFPQIQPNFGKFEMLGNNSQLLYDLNHV